ncbi:hypothetical protein EXS65_02835 [Candidatus Peribacteria bacterium]|nr:hypothetical protein [Candidatus Peribacteria bacterium]
MHLRGSLFTALLLTGLFVPFSSHAVPQASITVEQVSGKSLGSWVLLSGNGTTHSSTDPGVNNSSYSFGLTDFGPVTITALPPNGMSAKISIFRGGELVKTLVLPQYSFTLYPNDTYRFLVQYSLSRLGTVGLTSDPSGVRFRMKGRGTRTYSGVTPFTVKNVPSGSYSVLMSAPEGCFQPRPHTAVITPDTRIAVHVTINCTKNQSGSTVQRIRPTKRSLVDYAEQREFNSRGTRK